MVRIRICFAAGAMHNPHICLCIEVPGFQQDDRRLYGTLSPYKRLDKAQFVAHFVVAFFRPKQGDVAHGAR